MKKLLIILSLLILAIVPVNASTFRVSATITITNSPYPTNGATLTVNTNTFTWTNGVPLTNSIVDDPTLGGSATNLFTAIALHPIYGQIRPTQPSSNVVVLWGAIGKALTVTASGTWASVTYFTNTINGAAPVMVPGASEVQTSTEIYNVSQLCLDILNYATNLSVFEAGLGVTGGAVGLTNNEANATIFANTVTSTEFIGSGAGLTSVPASSLTGTLSVSGVTGTLPYSALPSGVVTNNDANAVALIGDLTLENTGGSAGELILKVGTGGTPNILQAVAGVGGIGMNPYLMDASITVWANSLIYSSVGGSGTVSGLWITYPNDSSFQEPLDVVPQNLNLPNWNNQEVWWSQSNRYPMTIDCSGGINPRVVWTPMTNISGLTTFTADPGDRLIQCNPSSASCQIILPSMGATFQAQVANWTNESGWTHRASAGVVGVSLQAGVPQYQTLEYEIDNFGSNTVNTLKVCTSDHAWFTNCGTTNLTISNNCYVILTTSDGINIAVKNGYMGIPPAGSVGGGVTSIGMAQDSGSVLAPWSPTSITSSGIFTPAFATESAHTIFAGPSTATAVPTFRSMLIADLPSAYGTALSNLLTASYQPLASALTTLSVNNGVNLTNLNGAQIVTNAPINVKGPPYFASGDGVTDDTIALQWAFNMLMTNGGGAVYMPTGRYHLTNSLYFPGGNTTLYGDGASTVLVQTCGTNVVTTLVVGNNAYSLGHTTPYTNGGGITLRDFAVDETAGGQVAVGLYSCTNSFVDRLTILNPGAQTYVGYGIWLYAGRSVTLAGFPCTGVEVSGCVVSNVYDTGIELDGAVNCRVLNNTVYPTGNPINGATIGLYAWGGSSNCVFAGNSVVGVNSPSNAIGMQVGGPVFSGLGTEYITFANNTVWGCSNGIILSSGSSNLVVTGNSAISNQVPFAAASASALSSTVAYNNFGSNLNVTISPNFIPTTTALLPAPFMGYAYNPALYSSDCLISHGTGSMCQYDGTVWRTSEGVVATTSITNFLASAAAIGLTAQGPQFHSQSFPFPAYNKQGTSYVSGSGAVVLLGHSDSGFWDTRMSTGTTAAGVAGLYLSQSQLSSGSGSDVECAANTIILSALSTTSQEYWATFGESVNITGAYPTDGAYFLYDAQNQTGDAGSNPTHWLCVTRASSTSTVKDSGVTVLAGVSASDAQTLKVVLGPGAAVFYVNGNPVATNTVNVTSTQVYDCNACVTKTVGTTATLVYLLDAWYGYYWTFPFPPL